MQVPQTISFALSAINGLLVGLIMEGARIIYLAHRIDRVEREFAVS